jgi:hypothetical protein
MDTEFPSSNLWSHHLARQQITWPASLFDLVMKNMDCHYNNTTMMPSKVEWYCVQASSQSSYRNVSKRLTRVSSHTCAFHLTTLPAPVPVRLPHTPWFVLHMIHPRNTRIVEHDISAGHPPVNFSRKAAVHEVHDVREVPASIHGDTGERASRKKLHLLSETLKVATVQQQKGP